MILKMGESLGNTSVNSIAVNPVPTGVYCHDCFQGLAS